MHKRHGDMHHRLPERETQFFFRPIPKQTFTKSRETQQYHESQLLGINRNKLQLFPYIRQVLQQPWEIDYKVRTEFCGLAFQKYPSRCIVYESSNLFELVGFSRGLKVNTNNVRIQERKTPWTEEKWPENEKECVCAVQHLWMKYLSCITLMAAIYRRKLWGLIA